MGNGEWKIPIFSIRVNKPQEALYFRSFSPCSHSDGQTTLRRIDDGDVGTGNLPIQAGNDAIPNRSSKKAIVSVIRSTIVLQTLKFETYSSSRAVY